MCFCDIYVIIAFEIKTQKGRNFVMAFDSTVTFAIVNELKSNIISAKIDKVYQPEKDEILISLRTFSSTYKLVISASSANARVHFTEQTKENPKTAPLFCMLLRKHLQSGKIVEIKQPDFERIIDITVEIYNELGDKVQNHLIAEIMSRNSNIILTDENYKILDCIKHIDFTQNSVRQLLPGLIYVAPPQQDKIPILDSTKILDLDFSYAESVAKSIMAQISGISPMFSREASFLACGDVGARECDKNKLIAIIEDFRKSVLENKITPTVISEKATGRLIDFTLIPPKQYGDAVDLISFSTASDMVEEFYRVRDIKERTKQKSADIVKLLNTNIERAGKKLAIQKVALSDAKNKDLYKKYGDIITSSIYMLSQGMTEATLPDYLADGAEITVPLSPTLSPAENAQKYYKKYNKAKTAETETAKQIEMTTAEIEYLESTLVLVENCTTLSDINAVKQELAEQGYIKRQISKKKQSESTSKPHHFISSDGFDIYVGKNNMQNDKLTLHFANSNDIWFHTKKIHGSHTVIKLGIDKNVPKSTMMEAATLAAYFSKARESNQVPVDYTEIKNVKKPSGAKPGMVIYDHYNTIYTTPKSPDELNIKTL